MVQAIKKRNNKPNYSFSTVLIFKQQFFHHIVLGGINLVNILKRIRISRTK